MRYDDVMAKLNWGEGDCESHSSSMGATDGDPRIQTLKRCLSIHNDKMQELEHLNIITFAVPWSTDSVVHKDEDGRLFRLYKITDLRDNFATLRVYYGSKSELDEMQEWKLNCLWGLLSITMKTSGEFSNKTFCVASPRSVLIVGPVSNLMRCLGVGLDGHPCKSPIDTSYHTKYCEICKTKVSRSERRHLSDIRSRLKAKQSRRALLDPFAGRVKVDSGSKAPTGSKETTGVSSPSRKNRKTDHGRKQCSVATDLTDGLVTVDRPRKAREPTRVLETADGDVRPASPHHGARSLGSVAADLAAYVKQPEAERTEGERNLQRIVKDLEELKPTGEELSTDSIKNACILTNLALAASYNRHSEIGIRLESLRRMFKLRRRNHEKKNEKQPPNTSESHPEQKPRKLKDSNGRRRELGVNDVKEPQIEGAFENLNRVANGAAPLELCKEDSPTTGTSVSAKAKRPKKNKEVFVKPKADFASSLGNEADLKATIEACLAKKAAIDHLL